MLIDKLFNYLSRRQAQKQKVKLIREGVKSFKVFNQMTVYFSPIILAGENFAVQKNVTISGSGKIVFGDDCFVGHNCFFSIWSKEGIKIGNDVLIADNVTFHDSDHGFCRDKLIREQQGYFKGIIVGNDVWIGTGVHILKGCNIGNGSVIGAGSVVTYDTPEYSISVGNPAKVIGYRR